MLSMASAKSVNYKDVNIALFPLIALTAKTLLPFNIMIPVPATILPQWTSTNTVVSVLPLTAKCVSQGRGYQPNVSNALTLELPSWMVHAPAQQAKPSPHSASASSALALKWWWKEFVCLDASIPMVVQHVRMEYVLHVQIGQAVSSTISVYANIMGIGHHLMNLATVLLAEFQGARHVKHTKLIIAMSAWIQQPWQMMGVVFVQKGSIW